MHMASRSSIITLSPSLRATVIAFVAWHLSALSVTTFADNTGLVLAEFTTLRFATGIAKANKQLLASL